jgi:hypothetical protein
VTPAFGDYVVYVDESGDHSLVSIDREYPVFVLAFCIFPVLEYAHRIVPAVEELKFQYFGHDMVVLHEHDIRKSKPPFDILLDRTVRPDFMADLTALIAKARFGVVASVIKKRELLARLGHGVSPYDVALMYGLERVFLQLQARGQTGRRTFVIVESRGRSEDAALTAEFDRIMATTRMRGMAQTLEFMVASKQANSPGMQLADMVARPIGVHTIRPAQTNRAWDVISRKIVRSKTGQMLGYGLKVYP